MHFGRRLCCGQPVLLSTLGSSLKHRPADEGTDYLGFCQTSLRDADIAHFLEEVRCGGKLDIIEMLGVE